MKKINVLSAIPCFSSVCYDLPYVVIQCRHHAGKRCVRLFDRFWIVPRVLVTFLVVRHAGIRRLGKLAFILVDILLRCGQLGMRRRKREHDKEWMVVRLVDIFDRFVQ